MSTKDESVKKQRGGRSGAGFDVNPQNINRGGYNDSDLKWRNLFIKKAQERKDQIERRERVADAIWEKAETGDVPAFKEIRDTMDGKPVQGIGYFDEQGDLVPQSIPVQFVSDGSSEVSPEA